jgi:amidase
MGSARRSIAVAFSLSVLLVVTAVAAPVGLASNSDSAPRLGGINIDATTIPELQDLMNSGQLTSARLVRFYLHRIERRDPELNSVIAINPRALDAASKADRRRRQGDDRPLLGIPIIVKDNINTRGMPTTAGSWALAVSLVTPSSSSGSRQPGP